MKYLSILLLCCISCSWNSASITTGYGQPTILKNDKQNYKINSIAIGFDIFEINLSKHQYQIENDKFNCLSVGAKAHYLKDFELFFVDVGAGFRLTEIDERNKWLADSHLLADISFSTGIKKEFKKFDIKLFYTFQHLSVPWRNDRGLNYDMIQAKITIPF